MKKVIVDGNFVASNIAYMFNDVAMIYPITPSSPMAENCDKFATENKTNIFDNKLLIKQMQSEGGVAGALHGSLMSGSKTTTFTSSQGLLLMIPNMYKIAGEGLPTVFYVAARSVASHALSIFCDYSDIYACLKTGFNIVCCSSVQEVNDLAIACELASVDSKIPYICFFDGFRTSHELNTIEICELEDLKKIANFDAIKEFKGRALNNHEPFAMGTNQNPDVFMQNRFKTLKRYETAIDEFKSALNKQAEVTNRYYDTIEYIGDKNAKNIVVCMGSAADILTLAKKQYKGKVGIIKVRMLKPFDEKSFIEKLPKGVKNISILERNLDVNGTDTLTSMVLVALQKHKINANCYSGTFGLGGKEFTPDMAIAVFDNMNKLKKINFSIGIIDDECNTSLQFKDSFIENENDFSMRVYGLGSDGSVSSVKSIIKILGENTNKFVQGYFDYDSKKSSSLTISHLRMSETPINKPFNPRLVDFVMCNNEGFIEKYDITDCLKENGTLLINTDYSMEKLNLEMKNKLKKDIIEKNINVYTIDANKIAFECGLGGKINTIMQTAMFKIADIIPFEDAVIKTKKMVEQIYTKKGEKLLKANIKAVDSVDTIKKGDISKFEIMDAKDCKCCGDEYYQNIILPTSMQNGNEIRSSQFDESGKMPIGTSKFNKRSIPTQMPDWISEKCIQCGRCTMMCPHAAIRPIIFDEKKKVPAGFESKKAFLQDGNYRLQINPHDCTGCGVCSEICPVKALLMTETEKIRDREIENEKFALTLKNKAEFGLETVKDLQYKKPYFEFSGACAGCGETPYVKLATQLFGDRMLVANATGCSSIYGGTYPTCPYSNDEDGFGPSWANSLFEDNAEFGYGIAISRKNNRKNFIEKLRTKKFNKKIKELLIPFFENTENHEYNKYLLLKLKDYATKNTLKGDEKYLIDNLSLITSPSVWIFGGDGWAYDIGFGGLDHVVASGENVNILILDTEVYSNTGGQTSKSTPRGASAKFNLAGKETKKKDLASMLMTYKNVYVASVAMGANPDQCLSAFVEAEKFDGPSVIIAYAPCVNHGYDMRYSQNHSFNSVKSGYNTLFRYNPSEKEPMKIDSFDPTMNYTDYVETENRFAVLDKVNKDNKAKLFEQSELDAKERRQTYQNQQKLSRKGKKE